MVLDAFEIRYIGARAEHLSMPNSSNASNMSLDNEFLP